jgi:hypothetical protein
MNLKDRRCDTLGGVVQPLARALPIQNKTKQTSLPRVGFEPTIPVLEWEKHFVFYTARLLKLARETPKRKNTVNISYQELVRFHYYLFTDYGTAR